MSTATAKAAKPKPNVKKKTASTLPSVAASSLPSSLPLSSTSTKRPLLPRAPTTSISTATSQTPKNNRKRNSQGSSNSKSSGNDGNEYKVNGIVRAALNDTRICGNRAARIIAIDMKTCELKYDDRIDLAIPFKRIEGVTASSSLSLSVKWTQSNELWPVDNLRASFTFDGVPTPSKSMSASLLRPPLLSSSTSSLPLWTQKEGWRGNKVGATMFEQDGRSLTAMKLTHDYDLITINDFMSDDEIKQILSIGRSSSMNQSQTSGGITSDRRTSYQADIQNHHILYTIQQRIASFIGMLI
jgi:hypothetical protein